MALTNAEKQARFREKRDAELEALRQQGQAAVDALISATERGRCGKRVDGIEDLPTWEALAELVARLNEHRLIWCQREDVAHVAEDVSAS